MEKKDFNIASRRLISLVDFIKWTSTFGEGAIQQMETPVSGVRLSPALSRLFGIASDDSGWMLTMREEEGGWLRDLPVACAFVGFSDELLIVTEEFNLLDTPFPRVGVGVFVPDPQFRAAIAEQSLLGFGLIRCEGEAVTVQRVNKIVPLYTPERYESARIENVGKLRSLFGGN